jgi:hypothetical protein
MACSSRIDKKRKVEREHFSELTAEVLDVCSEVKTACESIELGTGDSFFAGYHTQGVASLQEAIPRLLEKLRSLEREMRNERLVGKFRAANDYPVLLGGQSGECLADAARSIALDMFGRISTAVDFDGTLNWLNDGGDLAENPPAFTPAVIEERAKRIATEMSEAVSFDLVMAVGQCKKELQRAMQQETGNEQPQQKRSGRPTDSEVQKRRDKVAELSKSGKRPGEIAAELKVRDDTIRKDIELLRKDGTLENVK